VGRDQDDTTTAHSTQKVWTALVFRRTEPGGVGGIPIGNPRCTVSGGSGLGGIPSSMRILEQERGRTVEVIVRLRGDDTWRRARIGLFFPFVDAVPAMSGGIPQGCSSASALISTSLVPETFVIRPSSSFPTE
jgi:hypothetical protein